MMHIDEIEKNITYLELKKSDLKREYNNLEKYKKKLNSFLVYLLIVLGTTNYLFLGLYNNIYIDIILSTIIGASSMPIIKNKMDTNENIHNLKKEIKEIDYDIKINNHQKNKTKIIEDKTLSSIIKIQDLGNEIYIEKKPHIKVKKKTKKY